MIPCQCAETCGVTAEQQQVIISLNGPLETLGLEPLGSDNSPVPAYDIHLVGLLLACPADTAYTHAVGMQYTLPLSGFVSWE